MHLSSGRTGAPGTNDAQPLLGREAELRSLREELWHTAESGRGRIVLVSGEPGIGKSRLVEACAKEAEGEARVLWGRCQVGEGARANSPWVQIVAAALRAIPPRARRAQLGEDASTILRVIPEARELLTNIEASISESTADDSTRFYDAVIRLLADTASRQPLVVVLDDLHATDTASLELLATLALEVGRIPVLVLATYRNTESGHSPKFKRVVDQLAAHALSISPRPLNESEVKECLRVFLGPAAERVALVVHRKSEGNPLLVRQIAEWLKVAGPDAPLELTAGMRAIVGERLAQVSNPTLKIMQNAAVIGREFDLRLLQHMQRGSRRLRQAIDEAGRRRIIRAARDPRVMEFEHVLLQEGVYDSIPLATRQHLHLKVAKAIEAVHADDLATHLPQLAHHIWRAQPFASRSKTLDTLQRAARQATQRLEYSEAAEHYTRALQVLDARGTSPDPQADVRGELLLALGDAHGCAGEWSAMNRAYHAAADRARELLSRSPSRAAVELLARAALGFGSGALRVRVGPADGVAASHIDDALHWLGEGDTRMRALLLGRRAEELYFDPHGVERRDRLSREAVAMARRLADPATLLHTLSSRWYAISQPGRNQERLELASEMVQLARHGSREMQAYAQMWLGTVALDMGDRHRLDGALARLEEQSRALRMPVVEWMRCLLAGARHQLLGEFSKAAEFAARAERIGSRAHPDWNQFVDVQRVMLQRETGDTVGLCALVKPLADRVGAEIPAWRALHADLLLRSGQVDAARHELDRIAIHNFQDIPLNTNFLVALCLLSGVSAALADRDRAQLLYERLQSYARCNMAIGGLVSLGWGTHYLGLLATLLGDYGDAETHFEEALAHNIRMGARPSQAHTLEAYAGMLLRRRKRGDGPQARRLLAQAAAIFRDLGLDVHAARTTRTLLKAGGHLRKPRRRSGQGQVAAPSVDGRMRLQGTRWTIEYRGKEVDVADSAGVRYIAVLLQVPEINAVDLLGYSKRGGPQGKVQRALEANIRRLEHELSNGCGPRKERQRKQQLIAARSQARDLAGHAVPRAFARAIDAIRAAGHPQLAEYFSHGMRFGRTCSCHIDAPWEVIGIDVR